jgi:hypothetical protein
LHTPAGISSRGLAVDAIDDIWERCIVAVENARRPVTLARRGTPARASRRRDARRGSAAARRRRRFARARRSPRLRALARRPPRAVRPPPSVAVAGSSSSPASPRAGSSPSARTPVPRTRVLVPLVPVRRRVADRPGADPRDLDRAPRLRVVRVLRKPHEDRGRALRPRVRHARRRGARERERPPPARARTTRARRTSS